MAYLHGFAGTPAVWRGIAEPGSRGIALPGHGGVPVLPTWYANVQAVADQLGGDRLVVGYSLGARVALELLALGAVDRAVLVSVNPGLADSERAARRASDATWAALLRTQGMAAFAQAWEAQPLFASQHGAHVDPARLADRHARRAALDPEQLARSLETMGLAEMPDFRTSVDWSRVVLVAGADDAKFLAIAKSLPAPLVVVPGSGHDPTLEQPAALAKLLREQGA